VNGWIDDLEANRRKGIDLARQAIRFAPDDPEALATGAFALGYFGEDIDGAIRLIDRSLALNPSFARGWVWSAVLRNFAGQPSLAIEHYNRSLRLSPCDRLAVFGLPLGTAHFFKKQFDDAAAILLASLEQAPGFAVPYRFLASCYAHMGRLDEARDIVKRLRAITPVVVPSVIPYRNPEDRELFLSGLRLAAGEAP
jgi:tetratricopeptide (TPR) repeat protein